MELIMTVERIIPEEHALTRTLEKVNREAGLAKTGSKRHARLQVEKTRLENEHMRRVKLRPDR